MILSLIGCGGPISNQPFLDEALFLGSLPSEERLGAPNDVLLAPNGQSPVLAHAKARATDWEAWWAIAIATGDSLRQHPPDERTDAVRQWDPINVASRLDGQPLGIASDQPFDWWVQAKIVKPIQGGADWTIEIAADRDDDYTLVGSGHDDGGSGTVSWDLAAMVGALGVTPPTLLGQLDVDYIDVDSQHNGERSAVATYRVPLQPDATFGAIGWQVFAFQDALALTDDGATWPAFATTAHAIGTGGRAEGVIGADSGELSFVSCWDADGTVVYQGGDPGVTAQGDSADCPLGPF